ncbi:MAG: flavodoxin family protein [Planctomycetia bacterium]|nr:flavodoxin family protein [Planctomycetia bacterium]
MTSNRKNRRKFLGLSAATVGTVLLSQKVAMPADNPLSNDKIKIIALNGSPRRDKTTAQGLKMVLEAAKAVDPERIETELVHLVDYRLFDSERVLGEQATKPATGDIIKLEDQFRAANVKGIIVGSPVFNSMMSLFVVALFSQIDHALLQGKTGGALAVGGARNGGQESVVQGINTYLMHEGVILPGTGSAGRIGALCWNQNDSLDQDDLGKKLAESLGQRVAQTALRQ